MTEEKKNPRKGFIAYNKEKDQTFWCKNQLRFAKHWALSQSKISECLNKKIDHSKKWVFYFPEKEMQPVVEWKMKDSPSFIIADTKHVFSFIDEHSTYLKNKVRDN